MTVGFRSGPCPNCAVKLSLSKTGCGLMALLGYLGYRVMVAFGVTWTSATLIAMGVGFILCLAIVPLEAAED